MNQGQLEEKGDVDTWCNQQRKVTAHFNCVERLLINRTDKMGPMILPGGTSDSYIWHKIRSITVD